MTEEAKIRIVAVRIGDEPRVEKMKPGLKPMQEFVGGLIERICLDDYTDLWMNEEGRFTHSPNRLYVDEHNRFAIPIHGDFFISCGSHDDNSDGISEAEAEKWIARIITWRTLWDGRDVN